MRLLLRKSNANGDREKLFQFNVGYGVLVTDELYIDLGEIDDEQRTVFNVKLVKFNEQTETGYEFTNVEAERNDISDLEELLKRVDTLINTKRLRDVLDLANTEKFNPTQDRQFNSKEQASFVPKWKRDQIEKEKVGI